MSTDFRNSKNRAWNKQERKKPVIITENSFYDTFKAGDYYAYVAKMGGVLLDPVVTVGKATPKEFDLVVKIGKNVTHVPCKKGDNKLPTLMIKPGTQIKVYVEEGTELEDVNIKYKIKG